MTLSQLAKDVYVADIINTYSLVHTHCMFISEYDSDIKVAMDKLEKNIPLLIRIIKINEKKIIQALRKHQDLHVYEFYNAISTLWTDQFQQLVPILNHTMTLLANKDVQKLKLYIQKQWKIFENINTSLKRISQMYISSKEQLLDIEEIKKLDEK